MVPVPEPGAQSHEILRGAMAFCFPFWFLF